jgi:hypothetical protein
MMISRPFSAGLEEADLVSLRDFLNRDRVSKDNKDQDKDRDKDNRDSSLDIDINDN